MEPGDVRTWLEVQGIDPNKCVGIRIVAPLTNPVTFEWGEQHLSYGNTPGGGSGPVLTTEWHRVLWRGTLG